MTPATATGLPGHARCMWLVGRGVGIEVLRRKEFYVLLILMGVYTVASAVFAFVQIDNEATLVMLLNLGFALAWGSSHLLALITAARQIPFETENRTIYPMLAKPLRRGDYLLGKWAATTLMSTAAFLVLFALSWLPWIIYQRDRPVFDLGMMVQSVALIAMSLGMMSAMTLLFSLAMPQAVTVVAAGVWAAVGSKAANMLTAAYPSPAVKWIAAYLPDFSKLNILTRFTDDVLLPPADFIGLAAYAAILTAAMLAAAAGVFARKVL